MFFPQARRFGVAQHSRQDWYNMSIRDWGSLFVVDPSFVEGPIWLHVESLFRWRGFREGITNISSIYNEVLRHGNRVEQARAGLVNAIGISFVKDLDGAQAAGTIAHALRLLATIKRLDVVGPDKMEDGVVLIHRDGVTKHGLFVILVKLKVF